MIVYEVNLRVEAAIADEFRVWLEAHVMQMLALPGFASAERFRVESSAGEPVEFCVQYRLHDALALDAYLSEHAPYMRAEGLSRFGSRFTTARRVMRPFASA